MSQTTFERNGASYIVDLQDADCAEAIEKATDLMVEEVKKLDPTDKTSVAIRNQCRLIREFFDTCLGEGAGVALCGEKDMYSVYVKTYSDFIQFIHAQKDDLLNLSNTLRKYSNRPPRKPQDHKKA